MIRPAGARVLALLPALCIVGIGLVLPALLMLGYSLMHYVPGQITDFTLTTANYARLFGDFFYLRVVLETIQLGVIVTAFCLLLGFPVALFLARTTSRCKGLLTYLVFLPMMVGIVVRAYGWIVILGREGLLNSGLLAIGAISGPIRFLYTVHAVTLGLVEVLLPFMIMPILASIEKIDRNIEEAARALGASPLGTFLRVTLPLSLPGVVSGSLLVFSLAITAYALPALLGGAKVKLIAALAYDAMLVGYNWPFGSAIGIFMGLVSGTIVYLYIRSVSRRGQSAP